MIDVKDTGKGIPSNWKRIFEPGFTTKTRGWGLGLSLSRRIVEEYHQGKIAVTESEIGKGTTIRITLKRPPGMRGRHIRKTPRFPRRFPPAHTPRPGQPPESAPQKLALQLHTEPRFRRPHPVP